MNNKRDHASIVSLPESPADEARANTHGFDAFVRSQFRQLVQFLRLRTASEQDAEDAAQESLTKLLRYRDTESPSAWKHLLYRIAVNTAHDQHRAAVTHRSQDHIALEGLELAATEHSPEQRAAYEQQVARLSQAIQSLPPKCQRVYLLKRVHGLSRSQIAERCGISVKMVEKHLANALSQLRQKVGDSLTDAF